MKFQLTLHSTRSRSLNSFCMLLLYFSGIIPLSCSRDNEPTGSSPPQIMGIEQFPMIVGEAWTYAVHDDINNGVDTVFVRIISPPVGEEMFSSVWVISGRQHIDSLFVLVNENTLLMYDRPGDLKPSVTIVFPLFSGASWGIAIDTSVVRPEPTLAVPAGMFENTFRVDRHAWDLNYGLDSHIWINAGTGIVKIDRREYRSTNVHERWELVRFPHGQ